MALVEFACDGCTICCDNFALHIDRFNEVQRTHPGLLELIQPLGKKGVAVRCNESVPGIGCLRHPSIIGMETRPEFCPGPKPNICIAAQEKMLSGKFR